MTGLNELDPLADSMLTSIATALTFLTAQALAEDEDTALTEARRVLKEAVDDARVHVGLRPVYGGRG